MTARSTGLHAGVGTLAVAGVLLALTTLVAPTTAPAYGDAPDPAGTANTATRTLRILPLGASFTHGYPVPGGYRNRLEDRLADAGVRADFVGTRSNGPSSLADRAHEGHPGWRIDQVARIAPEVVTYHRPDVVLLLVGTNDLLQNHDVDRAPQRLGRLVDAVREAHPTQVFVGTLPPLAHTGADARARAYNAGVRRMVAARGNPAVVLVEIGGTVSPHDLPDGVHPVRAAYDRFGEAWAAAILVRNGD